MRLVVCVGVAAALVAAVAWGCGGNQFTAGGDGGTTTSNVTGDQACGDNARARCTKLASCAPEQMIVIYGTEGVCETRLKLNCLNAESAPSTGNTPTTTEACAQAIGTESCADYMDDNPPPACAQAKGALPNGQPCSFPAQCQSGFCALVPGASCGSCADAPQPGDSCSALTTCGNLLTCTTGSQVCSGFAAQGASCTRTALCGTGLYCVGSTATGAGSCLPAVEDAGAPCDPSGRTGPGCDRQQGLACNTSSRVCEAVPYAPPGAPCGTINNGLVLCAGAGNCTATATTVDAGPDAAPPASTCVAPADDKSPCDLVAGPFCLTPAHCVSTGGGTAGTCQFPSAQGCSQP
jgi:hypothetical protein